jgi:hypothetical protein
MQAPITPTNTLETVPAPTTPLTVWRREYNNVWASPFDRGSPAGVFRIQNAPVTRGQLLGSWSEPVELHLKSGWFLYGHAGNQELNWNVAGIVWKMKVVSLEDGQDFQYNPWKAGTSHIFGSNWLNYGGGYQDNEVCRYSGVSPVFEQIGQVDSRRLYTEASFKGTAVTTPAAAPAVYASNIPYRPAKFAWCRVAETGETELSPVLEVDAPTFNTQTCQYLLRLGMWHPQGTIGTHVYMEDEAGQWRRIVPPNVHGVPASPDDWLFPINLQIFNVRRFLPGAPIHSPAPGGAKSNLCDLHRMERDTKGSITVPEGTTYTITCPILDEWGTEGDGTPHKFYRGVSQGGVGGYFNIKRGASAGGHKQWPLLHIQNSYSVWKGAKLEANGGDAIAFSDYQGGKAFGNRFIDCAIIASQTDKYITSGVKVDRDCGAYGHTASELYFENCTINAAVPIWMAGEQTANIRFNRTNAVSHCHNFQGSVVYNACPSTINMDNGFYADAYVYFGSEYSRGVIFRGGVYNATIHVDGLWIDNGFESLVDSCFNRLSLYCHSGKLNIRGTNPILARYANLRSDAYLWFHLTDIQPDPGIASVAILSDRYHGVWFQHSGAYVGGGDLQSFTVLKEPTQADIAEAQSRIWPWYETGPRDFAKQQPGKVVKIPASTITTSVKIPVATPVGIAGEGMLVSGGLVTEIVVPVEIAVPERSLIQDAVKRGGWY